MPRQLYDLEIVALDLNGETHWHWSWWYAEKRGPKDMLHCTSKTYTSIFEAYTAAVVWATNEGPKELCFDVISYTGKRDA